MENTMNYLPAERGCIYEWVNSSTGKTNKCLVVSSVNRGYDNIISILFLSTSVGNGSDVVEIPLLDGKMCVHTDLITYTKRKFLKNKIGRISSEKMALIDLKMSRALDLERRDRLYEDLYNDLVGRMVKGE